MPPTLFNLPPAALQASDCWLRAALCRQDEYQRGTQHKDHQWIGHEALACFYPIARDHLQYPELWDRTHWPALRRNFSELRSLTDAQFEK